VFFMSFKKNNDSFLFTGFNGISRTEENKQLIKSSSN